MTWEIVVLIVLAVILTALASFTSFLWNQLKKTDRELMSARTTQIENIIKASHPQAQFLDNALEFGETVAEEIVDNVSDLIRTYLQVEMEKRFAQLAQEDAEQKIEFRLAGARQAVSQE